MRTIREWPSAWRWSWIDRAPEGKFLVITPDRLWLYSARGQPLRHLDLPTTKDAIEDAWRVKPSPGGKNVVVEYEPRGDDAVSGEIRRLWIDSNTLHIIRDWTATGAASGDSMTISDSGVALLGYYRIGKPGGPYHLLCVPSRGQPYCGGTLINDSVILSVIGQGTRTESMGLMSVGGNLIFHQDFLPGEVYRRLAVSASGQRFAIYLDKGKGGIPAFDIGPHYSVSRVIVYDLPAHRWVYSLRGKRQGLKSISALALSPDGSMLGLINQDGMLEVYRLPEARSDEQ